MNLVHYSSAVWGISLRFDPAIFPADLRSSWAAVVWWAAMSAYPALSMSGRSTGFLAGLLLFWLSPVWVCALGGVSDPTLDYRAYSLVLGWLLMLSAVLPQPWLWGLVGVWAIQSGWRSRYMASPLAFWGRVLKENGGYGARAQAEYGRAALAAEE